MDNKELDKIMDHIYHSNQYSPQTAQLIMLEVISKLLIEMRDELKQRRNNNG